MRRQIEVLALSFRRQAVRNWCDRDMTSILRFPLSNGCLTYRLRIQVVRGVARQGDSDADALAHGFA